MTVAIDGNNGRGRLKTKRAMDRQIVDIASARGRGRPHIPPTFDNRRLVERLASWVYICVDRNSTAVAQKPLRLYSSKRAELHSTKALTLANRTYLKSIVPQRVTREAVEIEDHPFLDLLDYVNPILDRFGLFWLTSAYLQLDGNAYWHIALDNFGLPIEMWPLPSQNVWPILGTEEVIDSYQLRYAGQIWEFPSSEILHFRKPSPLDMVSGFGNLMGILFAAETNLRMQEWENALFTNYAMPDYIISPKGDMTEPQQKQLRTDWQNTYGGWRNRGRFAVAPKELNVERLTLTAKEMQFKEGRLAVLEEIAAGFGVPMNVIRNDSITFNNMRHGTALWKRDTIQPLQTVISSGLNTYLMPFYGDSGFRGHEKPRKRSTWFVAFDCPLEEDIDADAKRLIALAGNVSLLDPNEARAELGREPADWGEEPYIPAGMRRPSEPIAGAQFQDGYSATGEETETPTEAGAEAGIEPEPESENDKLSELMLALERAVGMNDTEIVNALRSRIGNLLGASVTPVDDIKPATTIQSGIINPEQAHLDIVDETVGNGDENGDESKPEPPAKEESTGEEEEEKPPKPKPDEGKDGKSDRQTGDGRWESAERYHAAIAELEGKMGLENFEPGQKDEGFVGRLKSLLTQFEQTVRDNFTKASVTLESLAKLTKEKLLKLLYDRDEWLTQFADESRPFTVRAFEKGGNLGLIDLQSAGVAIEASVRLGPEQIEKHVQRLTEHFASTVVDVVGDDVYKAISDGLRADENVVGISKRIAATYGEKRDNSADRIARTELNRAMNAGAQETWKAAEVKQNEWLASLDSCEFCVALDKRRTTIGKAFLKSGSTMRGADGGIYTAKYGDVLYPPLHPNCTCTIVPVVE